MSNDLLKYEKLCDDLYYLGSKTYLRFNVELGRKDIEGFRTSYHSEFNYYTNKYPNANKLTTLRRSFNAYLSIENFSDSEKEFIQIRMQDMIPLRDILNDVLEWYKGKKYTGLFKSYKGRIQITKNIEPIILDRLSLGKYIAFEPCIYYYTKENEDKQDMGVRIYLSSENKYIDISIDAFYALKYIVDSMNIYESAQIYLNYLGTMPYGTNAISFNDDKSPNESKGSVDGSNKKRDIGKQKQQKSFFDKVDSL